MIEVTKESITEVRDGLRALARASLAATLEGMLIEAQKIEAAAAEQVPVDTGRLRSTHSVTADPSRTGWVIGFGTDYAIYVHEDMEARHPVGNAKFLERPFVSALSGMLERVTSHVRKALG